MLNKEEIKKIIDIIINHGPGPDGCGGGGGNGINGRGLTAVKKRRIEFYIVVRSSETNIITETHGFRVIIGLVFGFHLSFHP